MARCSPPDVHGKGGQAAAEAYSVADYGNFLNSRQFLVPSAAHHGTPRSTDIRPAPCYISADGLERGRRDSMSTIIVELYDALKEAGTSDEKARAAAQALANYDSRFSKIEPDLLVLKWMVGFILAGVASLVVKTFVA
jgi:hypothetical protein